MNTTSSKILAAASSVAVLLALAGCGERVDVAGSSTAPAAASAPAATPAAPVPSTAPAAPSAPASAASVAAANSIAGEIHDAQITAKVNTGLSVDGQLSAMAIEVDTAKGVVTLKGKAPSEEAKSRASDIARHVEGVSEVKNELAVAVPVDGAASTQTMGASSNAGNLSAGASASDMGITTKVSTGLSIDRDLSKIKIDVETKAGVVTLKGAAPSEAAKQRATTIARNVAEVKEVRNELKVEKAS